MTAQLECSPPPKHAQHTWHWIRFRDATTEKNPWGCVMWLPLNCWWVNGEIFSTTDLHGVGWDYVAPAIPPEMPT